MHLCQSYQKGSRRRHYLLYFVISESYLKGNRMNKCRNDSIRVLCVVMLITPV